MKNNSQVSKNLIFNFLEDAFLDIQKQTNLKNTPLENDINTKLEDEGVSKEDKTQTNELLPQIKIKEDLAPRLLHLILKTYPKFQEDYQFWIEMNENIKKAISSDLVIKQINENKKIPNELSAIDSLFYDIDRDADLELLTSISLKKENHTNGIQDDCN